MDLGKLKYMLSILVEHDHTNCLIYILQKSYLKQVLECFGMSDLHPVSTPLAVGSTLSLSQFPQSEEDVSKYMSSSQMVDLGFILSFIFFSIYFFIFLFLEYRVRGSDSHKSQDAWKDIESSRRIMLYNV